MQEQPKQREVPSHFAAPAPPMPEPMLARPARSAPVIASTEPVDLERLRNMLFRGPTPFRGETTRERLAGLGEAATASDVREEPETEHGADETAMYVPSEEERKQFATLPFAPGKPAATPEASGEPPTAARVEHAPTEPLDLEHLRNMLFRGPTPFAGTTTPERLAEIEAASKSSAATELVRPPSDLPGTDETAMAIPSDAMRAAIAALPFATDGASGAPMTVEGYACLAAQLQAHGATQEVLSKFGIPRPEALREVHAEQERQFAANPSRRAYFEKLRALMAQTLREPDGTESTRSVR